MTPEELKFIDDNIIHFQTCEVGFVKNIELPILEEYERLYKKYVSADFILTAWCNSCCFEMIRRLKMYYDKYMAEKFHVEDNLNIIIDDLPFIGELPPMEEKKRKSKK